MRIIIQFVLKLLHPPKSILCEFVSKLLWQIRDGNHIMDAILVM